MCQQKFVFNFRTKNIADIRGNIIFNITGGLVAFIIS